MSDSGNQPSVTFAIAAFNQERFIREAVEGAFAQAFSPLEIVLSDDCSEDRTFEIMREMAAAYRGPHRVVLNRNPVRRSIGGHVNRVMEISRGELIVGAAGDDVSLPQRTQVCYEAWEASGRQATSIHASIIQIDESGQTIEQIFKQDCQLGAGEKVEQRVEPVAYVKTLEPIVFGCAHAFSRQLFRVFGNLPEALIHEDNVLALRSILAGRLLYVNQPLVKYRLHGNNAYVRSRSRGLDLESLKRQEERFAREFRNRETMYEAFLADLEKAKQQGLLGGEDLERTVREAARMRRRKSLQRQFLESGFLRKCRILSRLRREGLTEPESKLLVRRLVPRSLLLRYRLVRG